MTAATGLLIAAAVFLLGGMTLPISERRATSAAHWSTLLFLGALVGSVTLIITGASTL